jgi:hypothetical protein
MTVAIQAPFHQQWRSLEHKRHLIDTAMAGRAAHTFVHVNAVVEVDKIRQAVNADPLDGFIGAEALANRLEIRRVGIQHGMAVHAGLRRRNARYGGSLHRGVTIAAIYAVVTHVVLVAELYGLRPRNVLIRGIGRARQSQDGSERQPDQKDGREQCESGDEIRAAMKNLGHISVAL